MEEFDETKDYKLLHLEWLKANRGFRPKSGIPLNYNSYFEYIDELYRHTVKQQRTAYLYLRDDYNWSKKSKTINQEIAVMFGDRVQDPTFFITFNFDNAKFIPNKVVDCVKKLFDKSWVTDGYAVFEYYTETGNHPHVMMKLSVNKYQTKGKLLDKCFESALAKFTSGKQFIDIKPFQPCHQDYLQLDKSLSKKENLEKDIIWRKENNLPEYLAKSF